MPEMLRTPAEPPAGVRGIMDAMHRSPEGRAEVLTGRQYRMANEHIGRIIAVGSGKGGVGKSTVTSMLALAAAKQGLKAGILDADITGPSIPKLFGLEHLPQPTGEKLEPAVSTAGIRIMSINLLLDDPAKPVVWRGPMVGSVITQFYTDLDWGKLDYLFIDLPPGTSDAPLSVMQSIPVDGFVLVTSPQELSVLVVEKAAAMTKMLDVPLIGVVENMAWLKCPDCGKRIDLFGGSHTGRLESSWGVPLWTTMPVEPSLTALADAGRMDHYADHGVLDTLFGCLDDAVSKLPRRADTFKPLLETADQPDGCPGECSGDAAGCSGSCGSCPSAGGCGHSH